MNSQSWSSNQILLPKIFNKNVIKNSDTAYVAN